MSSLRFFKLFKQDEATLMTKADLQEAKIVVLGNVEEMLADATRQSFNRAIVTIWDDRRNLHSMFRPFRSLPHVGRGKDTTTISTMDPTRPMMAPDTAGVNSHEELATADDGELERSGTLRAWLRSNASR